MGVFQNKLESSRVLYNWCAIIMNPRKSFTRMFFADLDPFFCFPGKTENVSFSSCYNVFLNFFHKFFGFFLAMYIG